MRGMGLLQVLREVGTHGVRPAQPTLQWTRARVPPVPPSYAGSEGYITWPG